MPISFRRLTLLLAFFFTVAAQAAPTPTLSAPVRFGKSGRQLSIDYTLPVAANPGSVTLKFNPLGTFVSYTLTFADADSTMGRHTFTVDVTDPTASSHIASGDAIPDGDYDIVDFLYFAAGGLADSGDFQFNATQFQPGFTIDAKTLPPTLSGPIANRISYNPVQVDLQLGETATAGTVKLIFSNATDTRTLTLTGTSAARQQFSIDPLNPTVGSASAYITSIDGGPTIPDGTYDVQISYQDEVGNTAATVTHSGVVIDSTNPQVTIPAAARNASEGTLADYTGLAQVTEAHSYTLSQDPPAGTPITPGQISVTIIATDASFNVGTATFPLSVRPSVATHSSIATSGGAAPGRNTNGLPGDALIASFGVPATDDASDIAYLAKWTSGKTVKGSGLFLNDKCLGIVGGAVSGVNGATFKTFTDPVVDAGNVAFVATFAGTAAPKAAAVMSNLGNGTTPVVFARAGDIAPGLDGMQPVGGAIFKSFKAVTIQGTAIGFLAQLASGTTEKVAAGNDMGVWIKDGSNALALAVREGDKRSGKTIDTLVSFAGGNGSAGQGRGWITVHGSAFALALAKFTDKTWGIINAEPGAGGDVNIDAQTLVKGTPTSPALAGASFASLSFPAQNSAIASTFLGTLAAGTGPVTKADAQAIFTSAVNTEGGPYGILARQGQPASGTGANFNILKDPVLAEDGGIAFTATIKGGTIKAPADTGIWWQPPAGGALTLFAQGGKRPSTDLNDNAQWKSFGSLAIASGRGPIFTGTLATGPGGVKATDANGVWACDFTGNVRLAFRTGIPDAIVTGKTLKSFTLLTGSVGSTGVTRSFNNVGEVVWLATFTNGQTALVRTTVP